MHIIPLRLLLIRLSADTVQVLSFGTTTTPQLLKGPRPDKYMKMVVDQLRKYDLAKTEVYTIINLGLGLPRPAPATVNGEAEEPENDEGQDGDDANTEVAAHIQIRAEEVDGESEATPNEEGNDDISGMEALGLIIDSLEERFPEDAREEKMTEILMVLRNCLSSTAEEQQQVEPSNS